MGDEQKMKYTKNEYEDKIIQLSMNKNKNLVLICLSVAFVIVFSMTGLNDSDFVFNFIIAIVIAISFYFAFKKFLYNNAKKANLTSDIVYVEQEIYEDKIIEKVVKVGDAINSGEYYYKDIEFVKEDKNNFYLYLNKNAAIIVDKNKLDNKQNFKKILKDNKLIK